MGDYICGFPCGGHRYAKRKQLQTVELKVRMDCEGCELKVRNAVSSMTGVHSVDVNRKQNKVTVTGYVDQHKVLKKVRSTGKRVEIWPYVPYNLVTHPHGSQTYDKKAPPGYVRNVEVVAVSSQPLRQDDLLTDLFSDDNPNACSIM
ncbi:heavy metal-associated domain containing protein [Musa troglodytarum]|uniref:Heavy metal-associated domain containing protein n=1 Tax=Musa troglodytarum TaxID=320322 RepID=A0A9E7IEJ9_9LILI|nr:heavy metal-associated domain containing protein [Musa troglodytarum]